MPHSLPRISCRARQRRQQQRLPRLPLALAGDGAGAADADDQAGQQHHHQALHEKAVAGAGHDDRQPPRLKPRQGDDHVTHGNARRQRQQQDQHRGKAAEDGEGGDA